MNRERDDERNQRSRSPRRTSWRPDDLRPFEDFDTPRDDYNDPTDRGYDQAARSGPSRYAIPEGRGGVFGTTGGGTFDGGFHPVERVGIYDRTGAPGPFEPEPQRGPRHGRDAHFDQVGFEPRRGGPHAGKGPKNYRRSDERILEDVNEALTRHPELDASEVEVSVEARVVRLSGGVPDRRAKRLAEDIAYQVPGVEDVENKLKAPGLFGRKATRVTD